MHGANRTNAVRTWRDEMDMCNKNEDSPAFIHCFYFLNVLTSVMSFSCPSTHENDGFFRHNASFIQMQKTGRHFERSFQ